MNTTTIMCTQNEAVKILENSNGRIFSCVFRKRRSNRELRKMICRIGVKKGVKGVGMSYNPKNYNLINVYDLEKKAFRMINLNTLVKIRFGGIDYIITGGHNGEE